MLSDIVNTILLYRRPTIRESYNFAITQTSSAHELLQPGLYIIQNLGPNIAYIRMHHDNTYAVTTTKGMPLFPFGSQDMSHIHIQIGQRDVKLKASGLGHPPDLKYLIGICSSTETASLRATLLTKN